MVLKLGHVTCFTNLVSGFIPALRKSITIFVDLFESRFQPEKKLKTAGSKLSSGLVVSL